MVNNLDGWAACRCSSSLRDVGKHFAVNQMIQRDSVKQRFESARGRHLVHRVLVHAAAGVRLPELYRRHGCRLQCGRSDQWGNIVSGVDLVRRIEGKTVYGLTTPLLTDASGKKYGKSEKGAVYLDPALTSPYAFYQFWLNTEDANVGRFLRWLTVRSREEIESLRGVAGRRAPGAARAGAGPDPPRSRRGGAAARAARDRGAVRRRRPARSRRRPAARRRWRRRRR
jgi:tyrosyl-tRNA synthetase